MPKNGNRRKGKRPVFKGRGGFWTAARKKWGNFQSWTRGAGKPWMELGSNFADMLVPGAGTAMRGVRTALGLGRYDVKQNSVLASPVPAMHSTIDRGIRICHHEFIGDVNSSVGYVTTRYPINPGMTSTFPWLSSVAAAFQKWEVNGLMFYLKSTSATALNSTNTALGTVIGAMQYNVYAAAPASKTEILALAGAADGKPSEDQLYPLECAPDMTVYRTRLIRHGGVTDDLQKYDAAGFNLARVGSQADAVIGELYVAYDITLKEPKLAPTGWSAMYNVITGFENAKPFGTAPAKAFDGIGLSFAGNTVTFPLGWSGIFAMSLYVRGTSTATTIPTPTFQNAENVTVGAGNNATYFGPGAAENGTRFYMTLFFRIPDPTKLASVTFGGGGFPAAPTQASLWVEQCEPGIVFAF